MAICRLERDMKNMKIRVIKKNKLLKTAFPWLLLSPTILFIVLFNVYPTLRSFSYSLYNYQRAKPKAYGFIGLENYISIIHDPKFLTSLQVSLKWVFWQVSLQVVIGILMAVILNSKFKGRGVFRTICIAPWAISGVLTTMLWLLMYSDSIGFINGLLRAINRKSYTMAWLSNMDTVFKSVIIAGLWKGIPFYIINMLAALQGIPADIYEAARMDGANSWKMFWKITMPYLKGTIVFTTIMRCISEFQTVDMILTMTNGGPVNKTTTLQIYIYQKTITEGNYGYGAALAVCSFLILLVFSIFYLKLNNWGRGAEES